MLNLQKREDTAYNIFLQYIAYPDEAIFVVNIESTNWWWSILDEAKTCFNQDLQ